MHFNGNRKYLHLIPLVILAFLAEAMYYASKKIDAAQLQEKYIQIIESVDMIAAAVEANPDRIWYDHEANIRDSIEYLDGLYQIYGAAYKLIDGKLEIITTRVYETSIFEPLEYPELMEEIFANDSGRHAIGYTPRNQTFRTLYIYYRWMPLYSPHGDRYLVIGGVSEHSIQNRISLLETGWLWIAVIVTAAITIWPVILLIRLGHIYESRNGPDKYRAERR